MMKNIPVYKHTAAYAREHDELAAYRASNPVSYTHLDVYKRQKMIGRLMEAFLTRWLLIFLILKT